jgi:hypothetical protein
VQHDCCLHSCKPTGLRPVVHERQSTSKHLRFIEHTDDSHFVINMHAMHNAHRVRRVLDRNLVQPKHLYTNRVARHHEIARNMKTSQDDKRARVQAKSKLTREENARKKADKATRRASKRVRLEVGGETDEDEEDDVD